MTAQCCNTCLVTCEAIADQECTFCSNTAIPEYTINYPRTGTILHCRDCAVEFGLPEAGYQQPVDN